MASLYGKEPGPVLSGSAVCVVTTGERKIEVEMGEGRGEIGQTVMCRRSALAPAPGTGSFIGNQTNLGVPVGFFVKIVAAMLLQRELELAVQRR